MSTPHAIIAAAWIIWFGIQFTHWMDLVAGGSKGAVKMAQITLVLAAVATLLGLFL